MTAFDILAASLDRTCPDFPVDPGDMQPGICCMTGQFATETTARANAIKTTFTRLDTLRAPDSKRASMAVYLSLGYKWERMSSWIADGKTFKRLDRVGVRNAVFGDLPETPWIGYATTSYKKHGVLLTPVNSGDRRIWAFENEVVSLSGDWLDWWRVLNETLRAGFGRSVLETLECPAFLMRTNGLATWTEFEAWARPKYKTALYRFLCYLLPSQEELKNE